MDREFFNALKDYAKTIKNQGWKAGESLIEKYKKRFPDFDKWATAMTIMLRLNEMLEEE